MAHPHVDRDNNKSGRMRVKRGDTHIGSVEKTYGIDLGTRSDMHLETFLKKKGLNSLSQLIKDGKRR